MTCLIIKWGFVAVVQLFVLGVYLKLHLMRFIFLFTNLTTRIRIKGGFRASLTLGNKDAN